VLLAVQLPQVSPGELDSSLRELGRLGTTLGLEIVGRVTQRLDHLDVSSVVGAGKLRELADLTGGSGVVDKGFQRKVQKKDLRAPGLDEADDQDPRDEPEDEGAGAPALKAELVLVDHDLSPTQVRNLERATGAEVLDRTSVILHIFQRHARSRAAKLQVEIARLNYEAPRVRESGGGKDRQRGGIGGRGAGESAIELDRRKIRDRIAELRRELEAIDKEAGSRRTRRAEQRTVALVGYTNAGKSSLMRALTGREVYVADELFATLDTTVRTLKPETSPRILVSDTVGFIKKLPHDLVASFRSTLDEAREAHFLLHVVDASDPAFREQMAVTEQVLSELGADQPRRVLLNKIDLVSEADRAALAEEFPDALSLSAKSAADQELLRDTIVRFFEGQGVEKALFVPYQRQRLVAQLHEAAHVLSETHDEHGTHLQVRASAEVLARFARELESADP
jgi:GTP-binding protein HflX